MQVLCLKICSVCLVILFAVQIWFSFPVGWCLLFICWVLFARSQDIAGCCQRNKSKPWKARPHMCFSTSESQDWPLGLLQWFRLQEGRCVFCSAQCLALFFKRFALETYSSIAHWSPLIFKPTYTSRKIESTCFWFIYTQLIKMLF